MFLTPFRISSGTSSGGGGTGMVNGATNVGSGSDIFKQLTGDILEFRGIAGDGAFISTAVAGDNVVITFSQANLSIFGGDVGAGGTKGLVPPPAAGDAAAGKFLKADGVWTIPPAGGGGGSGTVTSVGLSAPGTVFTVTGSPINSSGTLALGFTTQLANTFFAGGASGGASAPNFRTLVTADYPNSSITYAKIQNLANGSRLLGSSSAGGGPVQEISLGSGLNMSGTTLSVTAGGSGDVSGGAFSIDNEIAIYSGATGKIIKQSGVLIPSANELAPNGGGRALQLANPSGGTNKVAIIGNTGSNPVGIMGTGPGPNVGINYIAQLDSNHVFYTNNPGSTGATGTKQFAILNNTSAVNSLETQGGSAGIAPILRATGTDTNISLNLVTKGTGVLMVNGVPLATGGGSGDVLGIASSVPDAFAIFDNTNGKQLAQSINRYPVIERFSNDNIGGGMVFRKNRNATIGGNTIVQGGDFLSGISFLGADGTGYQYAAQLLVGVDGTPTSSQVLGKFDFRTRGLASAGSVPQTRVILDSEGRLIIGGSNGAVSNNGPSGLQLHGPSYVEASLHMGGWNSSGSGGPILYYTASRSSTVGGQGLVLTGDRLGATNYLGSNGTALVFGAQAYVTVNGAPAAGVIPTVYSIKTTDGLGNFADRVTFHDNGMTLQNGQIHFPAAQNPSTGPNVLDDYEEGTFTPYVEFSGATTGITYSAQAGNYQKVGNTVNYGSYTFMSSKGSAVGIAILRGLPFVASGVANNYTAATPFVGLMGGLVNALIFTISPGGSWVDMYKFAAGNNAQIQDTDYAANSLTGASGHYIIA